MIEINEIIDLDRKKSITNDVLRDLPEWFGLESSILEYIENVVDYRFFVALHNGEVAGFLSLDMNNNITAEIHVMGLYKTYHRKGIGKKLINHIKKILKKDCYNFLMVKTLGQSHPDENYANTRNFYNKVGFLPIQEIPEIWGKENPCLIMLLSL